MDIWAILLEKLSIFASNLTYLVSGMIGIFIIIGIIIIATIILNKVTSKKK